MCLKKVHNNYGLTTTFCGQGQSRGFWFCCFSEKPQFFFCVFLLIVEQFFWWVDETYRAIKWPPLKSLSSGISPPLHLPRISVESSIKQLDVRKIDDRTHLMLEKIYARSNIVLDRASIYSVFARSCSENWYSNSLFAQKMDARSNTICTEF